MVWAFGNFIFFIDERWGNFAPACARATTQSHVLNLTLTTHHTTTVGWKKNGAEVEQMQLQDLGPTANGTFYLQTLKREFDGKPVCSGYISYTYTPWGAMPSFFMDGGEKVGFCASHAAFYHSVTFHSNTGNLHVARRNDLQSELSPLPSAAL